MKRFVTTGSLATLLAALIVSAGPTRAQASDPSQPDDGVARKPVPQKTIHLSQSDVDKLLSRCLQAIFSGAEAEPPSPEEIEKTDVSLPFPFTVLEEEKDSEHLIFWDNTGQGSDSSYHEPLWKKQAEVLQKRLEGLPVDSGRIHVFAVKSPQDFSEEIKRHDGKKKIYIFGHGKPFVIYFGKDKIRLAEQVRNLKSEQVEVICHYGCSFVGEDPDELKLVQENLEEGQQVLLYGHALSSTKTDDSPWDPNNPILRCELQKDCVLTVKPSEIVMEFAGRIAASLFYPPIFPHHK